MSGREWSRRDFLRAAGIGTAGAALLPFIPVPAAAQSAGGIKRLVLFTHPNGTILHRWRSNGTGPAFTPGGALPVLQGPVLAPLERHRGAVTLVDGLDLESGDLPRPGATGRHGAGHFGIGVVWSGARLVLAPAASAASEMYWGLAPTIDQVLAASAQTRVRSLVISTCPTGRGTYNPALGSSAYSAARTPVPPQDDPRAVFDQLFAGPVDGGAVATLRRRAARRSILANVRGELGRLRTELPSVDRERLDQHLAGVEDLDQRIAATAAAPVCFPPTQPGSSTSTEVIKRLRLHVDIVKHAFACDLTRIANLQQGSEGTASYWIPQSELPPGAGLGDMHLVSHQTLSAATETERRLAVEVMSRLQRAMAEEFAHLLDVFDEGPGPSLLTDTLAVWGTGVSWGGTHSNFNTPFVVASKSPRLRAGRYLRFGTYELDIENGLPADVWKGPDTQVPHNRLLTSIMHLMGRTDVTAVGDAGVDGQLGGRDLDNTPIAELMGSGS